MQTSRVMFLARSYSRSCDEGAPVAPQAEPPSPCSLGCPAWRLRNFVGFIFGTAIFSVWALVANVIFTPHGPILPLDLLRLLLCFVFLFCLDTVEHRCRHIVHLLETLVARRDADQQRGSRVGDIRGWLVTVLNAVNTTPLQYCEGTISRAQCTYRCIPHSRLFKLAT